MAERFDPYYQWLSIPPEEQPPNHYRLLGTRLFEDNPSVIESAADRQMAHLRTFQTGKHAAFSQKLLNEVAAAKICLLNPAKKAPYDAQLQARLPASDDSFGRKMSELLADASGPHPAARPKTKTRTKTPALLTAGVFGVLLLGAGLWLFSARNRDSNHTLGEDRRVGRVLRGPRVDSPPAEKPTPHAEPPTPKPEPVALAKPVEPIAPAPSPKPVAVVQAQPIAPTPTPAPAPPPPTPKPAPAATPDVALPNSALKKLPVPEAPALEAGLKIAREAYQDEYARAQTPAARRALAKEMLQKGLENKDEPVTRFVLLRLARDVALAADDASLANEAIDRLAEGFAVDPWPMKAEIVSAAAKAARKTADHKAAAEQALALLRQALEHDACQVAQEMAKLALAEGGRVRDKELVTQARAGQKQAQQAAKNLEQIEAARAVLKDQPDDPAANLTVGRYECFVKGDWPQGLAHLAKGRDSALAALAREDVGANGGTRFARPTLQLADAWWDLAQRAEVREKESMLLRAGYWYQQLEEIDQPLVQTKVENRLAQIAKLGRPIPGPAAKKTLTNSIGMKFVLIPAGEFLMGSTPEQIAWAAEEGKRNHDSQGYFDRIRSEAPRHPVQISQPFYLGICEVTQGEYEQVTGVNPSAFSAKGTQAAKAAGQDTSRHPAEMVSWEDAVAFCQHLSALPKEQAARRKYRLPTEAEWEYACRAGTTTRWWPGDDDKELEQTDWIDRNSGGMTHAVGQKKPNAWGLYDMHGNVYEWCIDWFGWNFYRESGLVNPTGPRAGSSHLLRGGTWNHHSHIARAASRNSTGPAIRNYHDGFRVVCVR